MSERYKFSKEQGLYFVTCTTVGWVDIFTRPVFKNIVIDSLKFCRKQKGLYLFGYVLMTNHLHIITSAAEGTELPFILRDFKKFTSGSIKKELADYETIESRREWMSSIFGFAGR